MDLTSEFVEIPGLVNIRYNWNRGWKLQPRQNKKYESL